MSGGCHEGQENITDAKKTSRTAGELNRCQEDVQMSGERYRCQEDVSNVWRNVTVTHVSQ